MLVVLGIFVVIALTPPAAASNITMSDDDWIGLGAAAGRIVFDDQATDRIYIKDAWVGIGTNSPDASLDIEQEGTVKSNLEILHLTNTANAEDMDGTETSIAFFQTYYDESAPHVGVAAYITVGTETDWTLATETQDSYMAFSTLEDVNLNERMRITSNGNVGIGTTSPLASLHVDQSSSTGAKPVLTVDQADVSEEFIKFIGTSADTMITQSLVEDPDVTASTLQGWLKIYVQDDGTELASGAYYVPIYTLI